MAVAQSEPIQRWSAKRRVSLVVTILKDETSVVEAARTMDSRWLQLRLSVIGFCLGPKMVYAPGRKMKKP